MARGTRVQPGWNGSQTTTDRGAPNNSSAVTAEYTPPARRQGGLSANCILAGETQRRVASIRGRGQDAAHQITVSVARSFDEFRQRHSRGKGTRCLPILVCGTPEYSLIRGEHSPEFDVSGSETGRRDSGRSVANRHREYPSRKTAAPVEGNSG